MIKSYQKFRLKDKRKKNDLFAEVNWSEADDIKDCKVVKFTLGDKAAYVEKEWLNTFLFTIGKRAEQVKMIPQKILRSREYNTIVGIKAMKDIKKGEEIRARISLTLPSVEEEVISEVAKRIKTPKEDLKYKLTTGGHKTATDFIKERVKKQKHDPRLK